MELVSLVKEKFPEPQKCRHCGKESTMKALESTDDSVVMGYVCPGGYISSIVLYGRDLDAAAAESYLKKSVGAVNEDVRMATRYAWDLSLQGWGPDKVMRAAYWRQSYRRTENADPNRPAYFLCSGCGKTYLQALSSDQTLCPDCR